ncbi:group I truncated hemoglobin [Aliidiomarina sp. Khilg15.8]
MAITWFRSGLLAFFMLMAPALSATEDSLYDALGERAGIEQLMQDMLLNIADDRRIVEHFRDADIPRLHRLLTKQLCDITGGPCTYEGETMVESHTGMDVSRADFNALVENLQLAFDQNEVPVSTQNRLLALLADMHGDIVNR